MRFAWELDWPGSRVEPAITSLSWMGDAHHGQLAAGSESGVVGITLTDLTPPSPGDQSRFNFNLRGHHSAVSCVTWNKEKGKLASSDQSGVIYVWSRNDERWSVELVNDRGVKVRDVSWSPCGEAALICYDDNFVLIGSATGQRIWSNIFPSTQTVLCGVWAGPRYLVLGLSSGTLQLISDDGSNLSERKVKIAEEICDEEIRKLISCAADERIAIITSIGRLFIMRKFDQVELDAFEDVLVSHAQWTPDGKLLAAVTSRGEMYILDERARLIHRECLDCPEGKRVTAVTWAHDGRVIVVAVGGRIHVARVYRSVPSLYRLISHQVFLLLGGDSSKAQGLDIPQAEKTAIKEYDHHVIRCLIPPPSGLRQFVSSLSSIRCYCTIRQATSSPRSFTLCVEHMGGLVPILSGRQIARLVPNFQITLHPSATRPLGVPSPGRFAQVEDAAAIACPGRSSTPQRMSMWRRSKRRLRTLVSRRATAPQGDTRMAKVTSNVCCTRFQVTNMGDSNRSMLASVSYKTSVLHLQPRQMTVKLTDTEDDGSEEEMALLKSVAGECANLRRAMKEERDEDIQPLPSTSTSDHSSCRWHDELSRLEFIDGSDNEEDMLLGRQRAKLEFSSNLTRLANLAQDMIARRGGAPTSKTSLGGMRQELRELEKKIEEIEKKAGPHEVKKELKAVSRSLQKMKSVLSGVQAGRRVYTLRNKAPFWNETNQVYQLDFGGRVTQESAKNFQIEFDGVQSLQFGRIEGGAYTLDFRKPFTAVQAFAIALASITQRLK